MAALAEPPKNDIARLCEACQTAIDNVRPFNPVAPRYAENSEDASTGYFLVDSFPYLPKLEESSCRGCDFCNFLRGIILSEETSDGLRRTFQKSFNDLGTREVEIKIFYEWVDREWVDREPREAKLLGVDNLRVDLSFRGIDIAVSLTCFVESAARCPEDDVVAKQLGLAAPSNQSYCDDETVKWMNTAIRTCEKHEHGLSADSFIPERLVEVGGQNPRVVLRSDLDVGTPKYAALSYCWGSTLDAQAQLKTTKASLPERLVAINSCHLTAAVRDAVCVTKLLSLNYLWVDALCILQDSSFDWQHQCTDMAKIYGNAHVTLRAAASMSCRQGFLAQRGRRLIVPYGTNSWLGKRGSFLLQFKYVGLKGDYNFSTFKGDYNLCNLKNRGWAFQENVLSTRVLLFGHANVHFICEHMYQSRGVDYINNGPYDLRVSEQKLGEWDLYDAWDDILASYGCYTRSSFTKPEDLLPALSGLAALFNKYLQDDYLAGHWRKDLPRSLAWECPSEISKSDLFRELQASNPYLIPSWSRLCRGYTESTRVYPGLRAFQQQAQKLHAQVEREGENPFGAIKSAQLTIRSNVLDIKFLKSMELTIEPEWALHVNGQCLGDFRLDFWCESRDMLKEMQEYRLVLLGSFDNGESSGATSPREEEDLDRGACGLIVCSAVDPERFYRIGVFMPVRGKKNLGLFQRLSKVESITII